MKIIPLMEAEAHLARYGELCQNEPVIVTIRGVPAFQLAPVEDDDDLVDCLIETNPEFRALLAARRQDRMLTSAELERLLAEDGK